MTNHTPGPWEVREKSTGVNTGLMIYEDKSLEESHPIAISLGYASPECKANAQLISAAPELLEALRKAERFLTIEFEHYQRKLRNATPDEEHLYKNSYDNFKTIVEAISPAIAKAEGHA